MVIRGKRVNRCDTCTRRKVKCDEGKPACGRCKRAGLKCEGYTAKLVYVPVNDATASSHARCDLASNATHKPDNLSIRQQGRQSIHGQRLEQQSMPNIRIRSLLPDENTILSSHILSRFNPSSQAEPSSPGTLLTKIIEMDTSYSAQALTAIYFGKMRNQYEMYQKGQRFYGAALTQLQKWLLDPQEARKNDVLTSVLCLCLYEHVVLSEETAWLKHYEGIARLVEHRGPGSFQTKFERDVFQLCRCMIIKAAGVTKSHCFLAQDRWKVGRRSSDCAHQQVIDSMYDTMAEVPGLFHEIDRLTFVDKTTESPSYLALRDQLEFLLNELYNYPRALRMASDIEEDRNEILPPQNQAVAAGVAMCHASILCLALATDYFDLPLQVPGLKEASNINTRDRAYKANVRRTLACEVFHLAAATLRGEQSTSDAFSFIFSLQVAHEHLPPDTLEGIRLEGLLDDVIAGKHGFETGRTRRWAAYFNSPPQLGELE